jgi:hypothetical protein
VQDLSKLAKNSIWPTSQAGGNRMSTNDEALTALGTEPVDPALQKSQQANPHVGVTATLPIGTSGKPQASGQAGSWKPSAPVWGPTTVPDVIRKVPEGGHG